MDVFHKAEQEEYEISLETSCLPNSPVDQDYIPGRVILKSQKMVFDAALLNTHHYKVQVKGKMEQSRKRSMALPSTSVYEKGAFRMPLTTATNFTYIYIYIYIYVLKFSW